MGTSSMSAPGLPLSDIMSDFIFVSEYNPVAEVTYAVLCPVVVPSGGFPSSLVMELLLPQDSRGINPMVIIKRNLFVSLFIVFYFRVHVQSAKLKIKSFILFLTKVIMWVVFIGI